MILKWPDLRGTFSKFITGICLTLLPSTPCLFAGEIHEAVTAGNLDKVKALLESDSTLLESKDGNGNTPLNVACGAFQVATAHLLIDMRANVNARNNYGLTTLHLAIGGKGRDIDLIRKLISKGADVNARLDRGLTALHYAAMRDNLKVVQLLIDQGADLNACDNICYGTVLHTAINISPNEEIAKLLVESGAKINQKFSFENTELHLATMKGYSDLVLLLIKHGADIQAMNGYNHTALYYAAKHGYRKTADVLIAAGAKKSDITETNYGKAAQLTAKLKDGEAYLWYMGGFFGGGYAVKTKNNLLIFDKTGINESPEASLANGNMNPKELEGQKITVLITKAAVLNNEKQVLDLAKNMNDVHWVFDAKPVVKDAVNTAIQLYHLVAPNESININGIKVHTIPAIGRGYGGATGVGYIVETDGIKVFHSGFHVPVYEPSQIESYKRKIDSLKSFGPIDIAILTVSGHLTVNYEPYLFLIDQLSPKAIFLMGGDAATEEYPKCVSALHVRNIPVKYPESGRALGERFHYLKPESQDFIDLYSDYLGQIPPGDTPVVFAPGIVSTIYMEHSTLAISPDGNEIFWWVRPGPRIDSSLYNPDTWISAKTVKRIGGRWTKPMGSLYCGGPAFSPDGNRLYFESFMPHNKPDGPYFAEKLGDTWDEPKNIGLVKRFPKLKSVYGPTITRDGILYFASDTVGKGMLKDHVLYRAKLVNGEYTKLEMLPRCINLPLSWNYTPFIATDDSYLIFTSNRPGSLDNYGDLHISFHNIDEDTWSEPVNMGEPVNTQSQESSPGLSPDGKYLFYTSWVEGHQADVFWVSTKIIERLREKSKKSK